MNRKPTPQPTIPPQPSTPDNQHRTIGRLMIAPSCRSQLENLTQRSTPSGHPEATRQAGPPTECTQTIEQRFEDMRELQNGLRHRLALTVPTPQTRTPTPPHPEHPAPSEQGLEL